MKYSIVILSVTLSLLGCGKNEKGYNSGPNEQQNTWPEEAPEMVVVKENPETGEISYAITNGGVEGEANLQSLVQNNQLNFRGAGSGSVILNSYPENPANDQIYFIQNVSDFKNKKRDETSGYYPYNYGSYYAYNCNYQYGYWGYNNYCGSSYNPYYHYYPTYWSYSYNYYYQPAWYWQYSYYYYSPMYYYPYYGYNYYYYYRY